MKTKTPTEEAAYIIAASIDNYPEDYETILQIMKDSFRPDAIQDAGQAIKEVISGDFYEKQDLVRALIPFIDPDHAESHHDILEYGLPTWRRIHEIMSRKRRLQKHRKAAGLQRDLEAALLSDRPRITGPNSGPGSR